MKDIQIDFSIIKMCYIIDCHLQNVNQNKAYVPVNHKNRFQRIKITTKDNKQFIKTIYNKLNTENTVENIN